MKQKRTTPRKKADLRVARPGDLEVQMYLVDNGEGWKLALRRYSVPGKLDTTRRPVAILPGYGMNSFIFTWHPEGVSMAEFFAHEGFEFWTVDLRVQGDSVPDGGSDSYRMEDVALTDLRVVVDHILAHTASGAERVDLVGCSLGATYLFMYAAMIPDHRAGALVAIGGPLRWTNIHPVVRVAFSSPRLAGLVPFWGTGLMAELALPFIVQHMPGLLSIYLRVENVDMEKAPVLVRTIEDPVQTVNRQIAEWLKTEDLMVRGVNVTEAFGTFDGPLMCVYSNSDGIVPEESALSAIQASSSRVKETILLGNDHVRMAHADPYISRYSHDWLFRPLARWLANEARTLR